MLIGHIKQYNAYWINWINLGFVGARLNSSPKIKEDKRFAAMQIDFCWHVLKVRHIFPISVFQLLEPPVTKNGRSLGARPTITNSSPQRVSRASSSRLATDGENQPKKTDGHMAKHEEDLEKHRFAFLFISLNLLFVFRGMGKPGRFKISGGLQRVLGLGITVFLTVPDYSKFINHPKII